MLNSESLPKGYQIQNYRIEGVLGEGGFGITYKAVDLNLNRLVAIKEFMPPDIAVRSKTGNVEPKNADCEEAYLNGLMSYVKEAQALALFEHDNIVKVNAFLRQHNTAYIIMEYVDGMTFSEWLRQNPRPSEADLLGIVSPILDGLHELHQSGLLHRDIKPSNIYVCADDRPILLDFGAVRNSMPADQNTDLSVVKLTEGYAPPEQYGKTGQGSWTDIYAVGACLHLGVTGLKVTNAMERYTEVFNGNPDPQPSLRNTALRSDYSDHFLGAIEQAISLRPDDRFKDALALKNHLLEVNPSNIAVGEPASMDSRNGTSASDDDKLELSGVNAASSASVKSPADTDPAADIPTVFRDPGVSGRAAAQDPSSRMDSIEQGTHGASSEAAGSGRKKSLWWLGAIAGLIAVVWTVDSVVLKEKASDSVVVSDSVLKGLKSQIDRKIEIIELMKLPTTGSFKPAMEKQQIAMDIESKKLDGSVKDIRDNLVSADKLFEEHILLTAPKQKSELLSTVKSLTEKAAQLGVEGVADIDLSKFAEQMTDIESLSSNYSDLQSIASGLEESLRRNPRSYVVGSSAQDIDDAMEICKEYASDCAREWYEDELSRTVTLSPFEFDKSEVTVGQFSQYAEASNIVTSAETTGFSYTVDPDRNFAVLRSDGTYWKNAYDAGVKTDRLPVVHIGRADAQGYCQSLGKRLPTEAEWEYAARGPNRFKFPWGDTWDAERVNWGGDEEGSVLPVNSFQASESGYFDLAGGVTEWTSTETDEGNTAILKGGSRFYTNVANFRLPVRRLESMDYTGEDVGFRCAETVDEWPATD